MRAEDKALLITAAFEGTGFNKAVGNFDGMGISFGLLCWNFGMGTLQPLLKEFYKQGMTTFRAYCQVDGKDYFPAFMSAINLPKDQAVQWAKTIQKDNKLLPHWKVIFQRLGDNQVYRNIQMQFAERSYMARAKKDMASFGLSDERSLALFFDIAVQNGGIRPAHRLLVNKNKKGKELLEDIARAVASCANPRWKNDVLSRKMTIVNGKGKVHGKVYDLKQMFGLDDIPL